MIGDQKTFKIGHKIHKKKTEEELLKDALLGTKHINES